MCGVAALGARAASDASAMRALATLHDCAEDMRFRVRDEVIEALARIGEARGEALVHDLCQLDGRTLSRRRAVLEALAHASWLTKIKSVDVVLFERLEEGFVPGARRQALAVARYPGFKALDDGAGEGSPAGGGGASSACRCSILLARWSASKDPAMREIVERVLLTPKLAGRFASEIARVRASLTATEAHCGAIRERTWGRRAAADAKPAAASQPRLTRLRSASRSPSCSPRSTENAAANSGEFEHAR